MPTVDLGTLIVLGIATSLFVQWLKDRERLGTKGLTNKLIVLGVSVVVGTAYYFLRDTSIWASILTILGFAGATYTFVIEKKNSPSTDGF